MGLKYELRLDSSINYKRFRYSTYFSSCVEKRLGDTMIGLLIYSYIDKVHVRFITKI